jgi:hypothetical protein
MRIASSWRKQVPANVGIVEAAGSRRMLHASAKPIDPQTLHGSTKVEPAKHSGLLPL